MQDELFVKLDMSRFLFGKPNRPVSNVMQVEMTRANPVFMLWTMVHKFAVIGVVVAVLFPPASVATATRDGAREMRVDWSRLPPGGFAPKEVPQFVAITSDDNFGNEQSDAVGGVKEYVRFMQPLRNADGTPARGTFFHTTMYLEGNRESWLSARRDQHETAVHTRRHQNGGLPGIAGMSSASCCSPQHFSVG